MTYKPWHEVWSPHRVRMVEESARCFADQEAATTGRVASRWDQLTAAQQIVATNVMVRVYLAQEQALDNILQDFPEFDGDIKAASFGARLRAKRARLVERFTQSARKCPDGA